MSLTNKVFTTRCDTCGNYKEHHGYPDAGCSKAGCDGFLRIIDRVGTCPCGEQVYFGRFTNTCDGCGRDFNSSGQELAPREFWGEETGESVADILLVDASDPEDCLED